MNLSRQMVNNRMVLGLFGMAAVLAVGGIASASMIPANAIATTTSSNWAGYADVATSASESFSSVSGQWTVPTVTGSSFGSGSYSAFWVGLDGYSSSTVEQIGIGADVIGGRAEYYAWYEMYPSDAYEIPLNITAGNAITASVSYVGNNKYDLLIDDLSTHRSYSTVQVSAAGQRSSAEWIAEAPSSSSGVLPLANFGTVTFSNAAATMDGSAGSISSFSAVAINLVSSSRLKATTSALNSAGTSFSVSTSSPVTTRSPFPWQRGRRGWGWRGTSDPVGGASPVPEPSTLVLFGLAGLVLGYRRVRKA
ncbi:MAG: G1 family glutamic endopeptidase [Phycisphaerae bacterium]